MRTKTILLHSVSAIATAAAAVGVAGQAQAQVLAPGDDGYTFSIQGGLLFSPAEQTLVGLDKMGSGIFASGASGLSGIFGSGDPSFGYHAAFSVGKQIDENWDVRFGGSINKLLENTVGATESAGSSFFTPLPGGGFNSSFFEVSSTIEGKADFSFETLDFEVGYTPTLADDMSVRLFAGIRGLHFSSKGVSQVGLNFASGSSASAGYGSGSFSSFESAGVLFQGAFETEFFGVGPRVGVSAAHRFAGTNWGLSGTVAGAALFGRQTHSFQQSFSSGFSAGFSGSSSGPGSAPASGSFSSGGSSAGPSSSSTTDKMVFDLQVKGGVDFYLDDKTALTFGYQAEQLFGVGSGDGGLDDNKLVHGPFISLTGTL